jgi:hypothetical protein
VRLSDPFDEAGGTRAPQEQVRRQGSGSFAVAQGGTEIDRIYLAPPDIGSAEQAPVAEAFATNWIAPMGPHVDAFEREFAEVVGVKYAVAFSLGTAALYLARLRAGRRGAGLHLFGKRELILYLGATHG